MGVADDDSDLDIFIEIGGNYRSNISKKEQIDRLHVLAEAFEKSSVWKVKTVLDKTTVPIIMLEYLPMKLDCDVSVANGFAVENTKLMRHLFEIQPRAKSIYHYIRKWLKDHDFELKGYTLTLLLIYSLQSRRLMPTVQEVQRGAYPKLIISGWEVQFNNTNSYNIPLMSTRKPKNLKRQVGNFFQFYAEFNFDRVISLYHGKSFYPPHFVKEFPQFKPEGLNVAGPCNKKNCGKVGEGVKDKFIEFCNSTKVL